MTGGEQSGSIARTSQPNSRECRRGQVMIVARGEARFCLRFRDVTEVGRVVNLNRTRGNCDSVLGSMVLHGQAVPLIDVATSIDAMGRATDDPRLFAASRTDPVVCIVFDEILGKHDCGVSETERRPHTLIRELAAVDGRSLPVIDVPALVRLIQCFTPLQGQDVEVNNEREDVL